MADLLDTAARLLDAAERVVAFTGAGISTESGIPDFRGPDGVWTKVDPNEFTIDRYLASSETRTKSWAMWSTSPLRVAEPNDAHHAVVGLMELERLIGCVTQNIDGLHQAAGLPEELTVEVHGNVRAVRCFECPGEWHTEEVFGWVEDGNADPHCPHCGGIIKLTTVSFGQAMPIHEMNRAYAMAQSADAVIAVGTTLSVWPAAEVPLSAARRGVPFLIINLGETDFDGGADLKLEMPAGEAMTELVMRLGGSLHIAD